MNSLNHDLRKLSQYFENHESEKVKSDYHRLNFHLMPPIGWLNDPNGLCEFNGIYNVFYQYSPFNEVGGVKLWGHYTSTDMINWIDRGAQIFPDQPYDCHGAYSGSALVHNGKMNIFYTGNIKHIGDYDYVNEGRGHNTVLITSEDGENFNNKTLLMENKDYPKDLSCHVRDPKVWYEENTFYMIQGVRDRNDIGKVAVFKSEDMIKWNFLNYIESKEKFGYMWECPDLINLQGENILIVSPQGIEADGIKYNNVYQCGYYFLNGDFKGEYNLSEFKELDGGFDFYAPQTFKDSKGRIILIGWMGLPDIEDEYFNPTTKYGWQHALTVPRELKIVNNKLVQIPIAEIDALRSNYKNINIKEVIEDTLLEVFDISIDIKECKDINIEIRKNAIVEYSNQNNLLTLRFKKGGCGRSQRSIEVKVLNNIRILADTSSLELFINNGEEVITSRYYPEKEDLGLKIYGKNLIAKANIYEMKSFNIEKE